MIHVSIQHGQYRNYTQSQGCIVTGEVFYNNQLYKNEEMSNLLSSWKTEEQLYNGIKQLNGFYFFIIYNDKQLFAAVDRVRSIPLFYGQRGSDFFISDNAEWVRQKVGNTEIDFLSREEFMLTGYVTGADTLFPDVKQLQAGETLSVQDDSNQMMVKTLHYYRYIHKYETEKSMEDLTEEYEQVLCKTFQRLIQQVNGRTIVVPLSGGFDSRLIVFMLKRLGYENIIAFTYGRSGNRESEISRQVAAKLDIQWEFVEYSNELWHQWYNSEECREYSRFARQWTSSALIQDWPAVWKLKIENRIPVQSVFVPGLTADVPAGSRSFNFPEIYKAKPIVVLQLIDAILKYHYSLFDWKSRESILKPLFISKINRVLPELNLFPDNSSALESWDIAERQAKFIINSLRAYEYWGYQWLMPFFDYEHMDFWSKVDVKYRAKKAFYDTYMKKYSIQMLGQELHFISIIRNMLRGTPIEFGAKKIYSLFKQKQIYDKQPLAFYGMFDRIYFKQIYTGKETIDSFLVKNFFENLDEKFK